MGRFSGKTVIVTGSSNGIGRAAAVFFGKRGAEVTITGRNAERLEETRREMLNAGVPADHINAVVADITSDAGIDEIIESTVSKFGKIDILINNAGAAIVDRTKPFGFGQSMEKFDANMCVNIRSIVEMTNKAVPYLAKTKGDIVNISSNVSGPRSSHMTNYYSMAKAALDQYTRNAAIPLIEQGIRVNSISPGIVSTGFAEATGVPKEITEKIMNKMVASKASQPCGFIGQPKDIAEAIGFLADRKKSAYIIGHQLVVDGASSLNIAANALDFSDVLH